MRFTLPKRMGERAVAVLDWLWPFPLGIIVGGLLFLIAVGSWLALRGPAPATGPAIANKHGSDLSASAPANVTQRVAAPEAHERTAPVPSADKPPVSSGPARPAVASTATPPERVSRAPAPKPQVTSVERRSPVREVASTARPARVQPQVEHPPTPSKPAVDLDASGLSPDKEVEFNDKLTLGRFFMERKDYRAALTEFQAALEIDPSNPAAREAVQEARDASKDLEPSTQP